ncbi:MAG: hypothetical protein J2P53_15395, partial [Bradyrhizobiaceae bacterium]|nr:hypothetical protein [Bradyrhizobiaceae bacterium]
MTAGYFETVCRLDELRHRQVLVISSCGAGCGCIMLGIESRMPNGRIGHSGIELQHQRLALITIAVTLAGAGGLIFDALTPR